MNFIILIVEMDDLEVIPLHKSARYMLECCRLINSEWKRSETARLRSLECSCDDLPTSLVLIKDKKVIGHAKLTPIPSIKSGCFVESVVISAELRGKGFGSFLMKKAEEHCRDFLSLDAIYLSTKGQEKFYSKLGYNECGPISIYGAPSFLNVNTKTSDTRSAKQNVDKNVPVAPPLPTKIPDGKSTNTKTYMYKLL